MNEEFQINYYAVIPATVRYDKALKPAEKLLYGEVTALANKSGYCFAQNKYFAKLYDVTNGTVSKWLAHLQQLGYIVIELKKNEKQEIIARHIYITDTPYGQKRLYPYSQKEPYPMVKNDKYNIINNNIDSLFILIINNSDKISNEFYLILCKLELNYTEDMLSTMKEDKIQMIKEIIYVLYELYNSEFSSFLTKFNRQDLFYYYTFSKEKATEDALSYYKAILINKCKELIIC